MFGLGSELVCVLAGTNAGSGGAAVADSFLAGGRGESEPADDIAGWTIVVVVGDEAFAEAASETGGTVATAEPEEFAIDVVLGALPLFKLDAVCAGWPLPIFEVGVCVIWTGVGRGWL